MVAEGGKPAQGNLNGSAKAGGAAAGGGLGAWWRHNTGQDAAKAVHHHVSNVTNSVRQRAQTMKWSMPVDVKVDILRPTIETVTEVFYSLPLPVQQAAPFVGVAAGSGLLVYVIQQRRVNYHRQHGEELHVQVKTLKKEKEELLKRINLLKARSGTPRSEVEARMASAVAEATNAAAAAADAAARAATACIIQRPPLPPLKSAPM